MAKSKGEEMLGKAMRSKAKKKRGLVSDAVNAYTGATKALQNFGGSIRNGIKNSTQADAQIINSYGGPSKAFIGNPYALSNAKRKRSKRK